MTSAIDALHQRNVYRDAVVMNRFFRVGGGGSSLRRATGFAS